MIKLRERIIKVDAYNEDDPYVCDTIKEFENEEAVNRYIDSRKEEERNIAKIHGNEFVSRVDGILIHHHGDELMPPEHYGVWTVEFYVKWRPVS